MPVRVLIADDHDFVRAALVDLLTAADGIGVVGECADGCEVAAAVERTRPDVVLMDLQMPVVDGLTATREVLAAHPEVRVVVLTGVLTPATARAARAAGVAGYLLKDGDPAALPECIRAVAAGGSAWCPSAAALSENGSEPVADRSSTQLPSRSEDGRPHRFG
jgi:DNA-binding NarL/FixJ family response regulator